MFDIRDYMWDIFDIAKEEDADTGVGLDMFIANIRNKDDEAAPKYGKSVKLDYDAIAKVINIDEARKVYRRVTYTFWPQLGAARRLGDRKKFEEIVHGEIPQKTIDIVG